MIARCCDRGGARLILIGLATPTEAAAVGAVGAVLLAALRMEGAQWPVMLTLAHSPC